MFCSNCGHDLGAGRYCPQCGHPASPPPPPPSRPPTTPPTAHTVPPTVRYPLFADEADAPTTTWHPVPPAPTYPPPPSPPPANARRSKSPWVLLALALLLAAGGAGWLLGAGDDPGRQVTVSSTEGATGPGGDLTARARVFVPDTAPPNLDVEGNPVSYVAAHLVDGVPETCWRMRGDGTGAVLTIHLPEKSAVRRVGLINGYAKSATGPAGDPVDWYHGNRRVLAVAWVFDDGTIVRQALEDTTGLQSVTVDEVTATIQLRLLSVSDPGTGPARRDFTAISDLSILGD